MARLDIVDVIGEYVQLKRAGRDFKGLSPFTKEKTPSFVVHPDEQFYKCFSTGKGGDLFTFVMEMNGLDFMGGLRLLGRRAGLPIDDMLDRSDRKGGPSKDRLQSLLGGLAAYYREEMREGPAAAEARDYLHRRGLDGDIAEAFGICYAPKAWDTATTWANEHGYTSAELEASGMLSVKDNEETGKRHTYDRFRDRIMFPIRDRVGRVIGFSGRILGKESRGNKYVNSPETLLFKKSFVLYGIDRALKPMVDRQAVLLCEGQIDVIRCHQHGFDYAVAAQGTAVTEHHAKTLQSKVNEVILVMDSDPAGLKSARNAGELFLEADLAVRVVCLPDGDPDTFLSEHGPEPFQALIDQAPGFIDFLIDQLCLDHDLTTQGGIAQISQSVLDLVVRAPSAVTRDHLMQRAGERLNISPAALQRDLETRVKPKFAQEKARRTARAQRRETNAVPQVHLPTGYSEHEEILLHQIVLHPETRQLAIDCLRPPWVVAHPTCRDMLRVLRDQPDIDRDHFVAELADHPDCPDHLADRIANAQPRPETELGSPETVMQHLICGLYAQAMRRRRGDLHLRYEQAGPVGRETMEKDMFQITAWMKIFQAKSWDKAVDLIRILSNGSSE